jgi:hypothetical protein
LPAWNIRCTKDETCNSHEDTGRGEGHGPGTGSFGKQGLSRLHTTGATAVRQLKFLALSWLYKFNFLQKTCKFFPKYIFRDFARLLFYGDYVIARPKLPHMLTNEFPYNTAQPVSGRGFFGDFRRNYNCKLRGFLGLVKYLKGKQRTKKTPSARIGLGKIFAFRETVLFG